MYRVRCLKDFGCWCRVGKVTSLSNWLTHRMSRVGNVEIIEFLGNSPYSPYQLHMSINSMKLKIKELQERIALYEKYLKDEKVNDE